MKTKLRSFGLLFAIAAFTFSSCNKEEQDLTPEKSAVETPDFSENGANPDDENLGSDVSARSSYAGYLYTESNATGQNEIFCYKQNGNGSLTLMSTVASGGTGNGIYQGLGLDSQGALVMSDNRRYLYAVNAGSNSISSFKVYEDGSLALAHTRSSEGMVPLSLTIDHEVMYVVNDGSASIAGFKLGEGGTMTYIEGSLLPLSAATAHPAQIAFSPNGDHLYVTERGTNNISAFHVDSEGLASFDDAVSSTGVTPFGFSFARNKYMVVSNAGMGEPNGSSATSYRGVNNGNLNAANGAVENNQTAACWVATTRYGRFAYITNTGSNTISTYYVATWGGLYLVHASATSTGTAPKDICVAPNNYYVYALNSGAKTIGGYRRAFLGDLVSIGTTPGLPEFATGLVAW